jgi:predicted DCC family thiol-disulfide oxidoreductase YuxK
MDQEKIFSFMFRQDLESTPLSRDSQFQESILLLDNGAVYEKSEALIRITSYLTFPWNTLTLIRFIPPTIRDSLYDWIARGRYRWFGKKTSCPRPSSKLQHRFVKTSLS